MVDCQHFRVIEALQNTPVELIEHVTVHCSDGSSYSILKDELHRRQEILLKLNDFLFLVINMNNRGVTIVRGK